MQPKGKGWRRERERDGKQMMDREIEDGDK